MEPFERYLNFIDNPTHREKLMGIIRWIETNYPELKPEYKWNQPMYTHHGTIIIGFSTAKRHIAVAPEEKALIRFQDAIQDAGYSYSKKLFRIQWEQPVDYDLLKRIIDYNIEDKKETNTFWRKG